MTADELQNVYEALDRANTAAKQCLALVREGKERRRQFEIELAQEQSRAEQRLEIMQVRLEQERVTRRLLADEARAYLDEQERRYN